MGELLRLATVDDEERNWFWADLPYC